MSTPDTEPLPIAAAFFFAVVLGACAVWLMLTAFHSGWRRTVHWGRMQKGPPVSLAGHIVGAVATTSFAVWIIAYSIQVPAFFHFMQIVVGITSVALIAAMIRDFLIWK